MNDRIVGLLILLTLIGGCQRYQPEPLALSAYAASLRQRDVRDPGVLAYAAYLRADSESAAADDGKLDLAHAEAVLLYFNGALHQARLAAGVPQARADFAGLWDDPTLDFNLLRLLEGDAHPWTAGVRLGVTIPLSGRLAAAQALAEAQTRRAWMQAAAMEVEALAALRSQWLAWSGTLRRAELLADHIRHLQAVVDVGRRLARAGEASGIDVRLLQIDLHRHRLDLEQVRQSAARQRRLILARLGLSPDAGIELHPQSIEWHAPAASTAAAEPLLTHPLLEAARSGYDEAEQTLRREIARQYPDLQIGPAFEREEGQSKIGLGAGVILPLWNRNRGGIAEAYAQRDAARAEAQATYQRLLHDVTEAQGDLAIARLRHGGLLEHVAPLVDEQLHDMQRLIDLGELDVLLLHTAMQQSLAVKLELLEAALAEAQAQIRLSALLDPQWVGSAIEHAKENQP